MRLRSSITPPSFFTPSAFVNGSWPEVPSQRDPPPPTHPPASLISLKSPLLLLPPPHHPLHAVHNLLSPRPQHRCITYANRLHLEHLKVKATLPVDARGQNTTFIYKNIKSSLKGCFELIEYLCTSAKLPLPSPLGRCLSGA